MFHIRALPDVRGATGGSTAHIAATLILCRPCKHVAAATTNTSTTLLCLKRRRASRDFPSSSCDSNMSEDASVGFV